VRKGRKRLAIAHLFLLALGQAAVDRVMLVTLEMPETSMSNPRRVRALAAVSKVKLYSSIAGVTTKRTPNSSQPSPVV